jgi:hypothetical protein
MSKGTAFRTITPRPGFPRAWSTGWFCGFFFSNTWCGRSLDLLAVDVDFVDVVAVVILVCLYWIGRSGLLLACWNKKQQIGSPSFRKTEDRVIIFFFCSNHTPMFPSRHVLPGAQKKRNDLYLAGLDFAPRYAAVQQVRLYGCYVLCWHKRQTCKKNAMYAIYLHIQKEKEASQHYLLSTSKKCMARYARMTNAPP